MWRHSIYGEILDVEKFQIWKIFACGEILDVQKFVYFYELLALACQVKLTDDIILL